MHTARTLFSTAAAVVIFSLTPASPTPVLAQDNTIAWLRAGANSATVNEAWSSDAAPGRGRLIGLRFGAGLTVPLSQRVGLQLDGTFSQQGWVAEIASTRQNDTRHSYLRVAALVRIASGGSPVRVYVGAGPALGYQLRCAVSETNEADSEVACDAPELGDAALALKRFEAGVRGVVGVEAKVGASMRLSVEAGYTMGLTAIYGGNAFLDDDQVDYKNRLLSISVGAGIPVG